MFTKYDVFERKMAGIDLCTQVFWCHVIWMGWDSGSYIHCTPLSEVGEDPAMVAAFCGSDSEGESTVSTLNCTTCKGEAKSVS